MAFLDTLSEMARNMADKANDSIEINRINSDITMQLGNIQVYQRELGEHYWAKYQLGEQLDEEAMFICDKIVIAQDKIRTLEAEIEKVKTERDAEKAERAEQKRMAAQQKAEAEKAASALIREDNYCQSCGTPFAEGQKILWILRKENIKIHLVIANDNK